MMHPIKENLMPKAMIEMRYEDCGFVYTDRTRMLFVPKHTMTRRDEDKASTDLVLCAASGRWPEPSKRDFVECRTALVAAYRDRGIFADTSEGLIPIHRP
jgi:hypothetical protein